jgi:hypothetical protein
MLLGKIYCLTPLEKLRSRNLTFLYDVNRFVKIDNILLTKKTVTLKNNSVF